MEAADTVRKNGRRSRSAKEATVDSTADKPVELKELVIDQGKSKGSSSGTESQVNALSLQAESEKTPDRGAIALSPKGSLSDLPVDPDAIEIAETIYISGERPIAASHFKIYGTILKNRPIMASDIKVLNVDTIPGHRPIFVSDIVVRDDMSLPGGRPIVASDPQLMHASLLMGGRPIASNEIGDGEALMGFID